MKEIVLPQAKCKRCSHVWIPRTKNIVACPRCKSPYWDKEKKKDAA